MSNQDDICVVVTEKSAMDSPSKLAPIVLETYIESATLEDAQMAIDDMGGRYGECRIAKLVFLD